MESTTLANGFDQKYYEDALRQKDLIIEKLTDTIVAQGKTLEELKVMLEGNIQISQETHKMLAEAVEGQINAIAEVKKELLDKIHGWFGIHDEAERLRLMEMMKGTDGKLDELSKTGDMVFRSADRTMDGVMHIVTLLKRLEEKASSVQEKLGIYTPAQGNK